MSSNNANNTTEGRETFPSGTKGDDQSTPLKDEPGIKIEDQVEEANTVPLHNSSIEASVGPNTHVRLKQESDMETVLPETKHESTGLEAKKVAKASDQVSGSDNNQVHKVSYPVGANGVSSSKEPSKRPRSPELAVPDEGKEFSRAKRPRDTNVSDDKVAKTNTSHVSVLERLPGPGSAAFPSPSPMGKAKAVEQADWPPRASSGLPTSSSATNPTVQMNDTTFADSKLPDKTQSSSPATPTNEAPGIFDDADEDETFDLTVYNKPPALLPHPNPPPHPSQKLMRPDLVAAILGAKPTQSQHSNFPKESSEVKVPVAPATIGIPSSKDSVETQQTSEPKRRKSNKVVRKVLVAKREQDAAERILKDKIDLVDVLPEKDSNFLGKEMWIFTLQQLEAVLNAPSTNSEQETEASKRRKELKELLLKHKFVGDGVGVKVNEHAGKFVGDNGKASSESNDDGTTKDKGVATQVGRGQHSNGNTQSLGTPSEVNESKTPAIQEPNKGNAGQAATMDAVDAKDNSPSNSHNGSVSPIDAVEAQLQHWKALTQKWRLSNVGGMKGGQKFLLDGPLSCLIPTCTLNFCASANLATAHDFLCLKRTETGLVVDMYRLWRQKCLLPEIPALTLAKHLLAIGARIETALESIPPADKETRTWMGGHMIVLSGSAKDFLFTHTKTLDAEAFVERRTKELADILVEWRNEKNLPVLKGTGKVAMISGWKTLVKEARDVEASPGHRLTSFDLLKEVEGDSIPPSVEKKPKLEKPKTVKASPTKSKQSGQHSLYGEAALKSETFLATVFKEDNIDLLASQGIFTAQDLLDADKRPNSPLIMAIIQMRKDSDGGGSVEPSSCVRLIYDWCHRVRQRLEEIEKTPGNNPPGREKPVGPKFASNVISPRKNVVDPFDALSHSSKVFLATMGIKTAEAFLASKTTEVANEFIKYREENNMPALKGLGAVASVSGWKALVRKAAKDSGQGDLVGLNAGRNAGIKLQRRGKAAMPADSPDSMPVAKPAINETTDRGVLFGSPRKVFWVHSSDGFTFRFELSVRTSTLENAKSALYLTYLGNERDDKQQTQGKPAERAPKYPVLNHVLRPKVGDATSRLPFSSKNEGGGIIELSRYGVQPLPRPDASTELQDAIKAFVLGDLKKGSRDRESPAYNVFSRRETGEKRYYFFCSKPIEKGQTVELHFLPSGTPDITDSPQDDREQRKWIQEEISSLPLKDLRGLLDFLNGEFGSDIYRRIHTAFDWRNPAANNTLSIQEISELVISRRRMHWLALRINTQLQNEFLRGGGVNGTSMMLPRVALVPLWSIDLVSKLCKHPEWSAKILPRVIEECKREILAEFMTSAFGEFYSSRAIWCPLAESLFGECLDLLSKYSAELDNFCSDEKIIEEIKSIVTRAVSTLKNHSNDDEPEKDTSLAELILTFSRDSYHESNALPTRTEICDTANQAYKYAMSLCDEPPFGSVIEGDHFVVATTQSQKNTQPGTATDTGESSTTVMRNIAEVKKKHAKIDVKWYVERQILSVVESVVLSGIAHVSVASSKIRELREEIQLAAKAALGGQSVYLFKLERRPSDGESQSIAVPAAILAHSINAKYQPYSEPFFLAVVWPALKKARWSLEAGSNEKDVSFFPPGRKKDQRSRLLKKEAAKQRAKLARRTAELGLGYIPKTTKRMFINCTTAEDTSAADQVTVSKALKSFEATMAKNGVMQREGGAAILRKIVEQIESLFENVAPSLLYESEEKSIALEEGQCWKDRLGCEHLMRLLLVMPSMLNRSDISVQQAEDVRGVVGELVNYLVANQDVTFSPTYHLAREEYDGKQPAFPGYIATRVESAAKTKSPKKAVDDDDSFDLNTAEIFLPSDRAELTDFVSLVMSQVVLCRATREDMERKGRRGVTTVGYPGLVCRHCLGHNGDGKYFFSSVASLGTASTTIDKHIAKCPKVSDTIKQKMFEAKGYHAEQQRNAPLGSQSAFFSRLWERLRVSRATPGAQSDMYLSLSTSPLGEDSDGDSKTMATSGSDGDNGVGFRDHVQLLTYLQTTSPWKDKDDLEEAISRYYGCLIWGSRIFSTNAMPPHYSSEWILSKLGQEFGTISG